MPSRIDQPGQLYIPSLGKSFKVVQLGPFSTSMLVDLKAEYRTGTEQSVFAIAAQGASGVQDTVQLRVPTGLPLAEFSAHHLTQLWPEPHLFHDRLPLQFREGDVIEIESTVPLVVVLFGVFKVPAR